MTRSVQQPVLIKPVHDWVHTVRISFVAGPMTAMVEGMVQRLLATFERLGHVVEERPREGADILLTTAPFGEPLSWRKAMLFTARRRFGLSRLPTLYTLVGARSGEFAQLLEHFRSALAQDPPDPAQFRFPGMAPESWKVLYEQGRRGGAILSLERLVQSQAKSIRVLLAVGEETPQEVYHFDLVGAYPRSTLSEGEEAFYRDIVWRMVTTVSTYEVSRHHTVEQALPASLWAASPAPKAMVRAGQELGRRHFFTNMIRISDLVQVPAVSDSVASQYSEGCFATWAPDLGGLIVTATGSARPVDKGHIREDDLALVIGVRPDGLGALVRPIEGRAEVMPSSEGYEMVDLDNHLPHIVLGAEHGLAGARVPVIRSKLHGHRSVAAYDPRYVEYAPMGAPYFHYLVSCATGAQARGICEALARSEALNDPQDPRRL
ncbi:MAG: hypothetical protein H5T69_12285, partial [Chloroflexi bacterium]|nr:hypothetical protein [Chloroflexota bacterium]